MILGRFIKHTRDQNWYAMILDIIVVIVGIFLGMQVTEWNEDQQNNALANTKLISLKRDFEEINKHAKMPSFFNQTNNGKI